MEVLVAWSVRTRQESLHASAGTEDRHAERQRQVVGVSSLDQRWCRAGHERRRATTGQDEEMAHGHDLVESR